MKQPSLLRNETVHFIDGAAGQLELALGKASNASSPRIAIICHPHPLHGGTMTNKIVTTLVKAYQSLGFTTIRFNFRGVGNSEGEYSEGVGELDDALRIFDYATATAGTTNIALAGFSFGAYVAIKAATKKKISQLVTVAPPVLNFALQDEHPDCPWILVQGDQDEIVPAESVYAFAASRKHQPEILRFPSATHFFHGQLVELQAALEVAINKIRS